ncbi:hypothetical protein [Vibrio caribbeanicus]|uniref:hypothetical protein n=1 Tax=Vibrio caribbeanicus TaxID=701175 RepID=UPI0022834328|nr:hypothetical protein [Vibrio caribbeanicus]MCY9845190.1 hypothetical protein [Vibrio caribbeanicus]
MIVIIITIFNHFQFMGLERDGFFVENSVCFVTIISDQFVIKTWGYSRFSSVKEYDWLGINGLLD